ncbi:DNA/RNA nuclease SfsA [Hathewaya histolytica]|uniref:Sugar fermentation stimulation protein homolog n=1 Tax=Hathewaya histolytica TaxID=1498 RepID=A0A4U9QTX3_HATHI|nr:DNA/RNA nuclease SfsA [Hathewaya histolytica]VTQ81719.1 sugar fermentation stimulation protein A [Hathewaya histolytica]
MKFKEKIISAKFIERPNRFQAYVNVDGEEIMVHVPNTGRCREILIPGITVLLREGVTPNRKTPYDLIAGYKNDKLINIDSQIPNKVVEEALRQGKISKLKEFNIVNREKTFGNSRFDFKIENEKGKEYYLEVKGVTLENDGMTMFPDAPTERGRKHLLELVEVKKTGRGAGVLFLIQMDNVKSFTPHDEMDREFGEALRYAKNNGVDIFAYKCKLGTDFMELSKEVDVLL